MSIPFNNFSEYFEALALAFSSEDYGVTYPVYEKFCDEFQDADVIIMLWGASEQEIAINPELENKRKLRIVKQRNGVLLTIELDFKNEIQLFKSITQF